MTFLEDKIKDASKIARQIREEQLFFHDKITTVYKILEMDVLCIPYIFHSAIGYFHLRNYSDKEISSLAFKKGAHLDERLPWNRELNKEEEKIAKEISLRFGESLFNLSKEIGLNDKEIEKQLPNIWSYKKKI